MHLYVINLNKNYTKNKRDNIIKFLRDNGIGVNVHYIPIHYQPYFKKLGFKKGMFPNCESYYKRAITLPINPMFKKKDLTKIVNLLKSIF